MSATMIRNMNQFFQKGRITKCLNTNHFLNTFIKIKKYDNTFVHICVYFFVLKLPSYRETMSFIGSQKKAITLEVINNTINNAV